MDNEKRTIFDWIVLAVCSILIGFLIYWMGRAGVVGAAVSVPASHLWHFDATSTDSITGLAPSLVSGFTSSSYSSGIFNQALAGPPGSAYYLAYNQGTSTEASLTLGGWINQSSTVNQYWLTNHGGSGNPLYAWIGIQSGNDVGIFLVNIGGIEYYASGTLPSFTTSTWHQMTGTYGSNVLKLYWDGSLVGTATTTGSLSIGGKWYIGSNPFTGGSTSDYRYDDFFVSTSTLSATDVSNIWNGGTGQVITASSTSGSISFAFPRDFSVGPDFSNWIFTLSNATSGDVVQVNYDRLVPADTYNIYSDTKVYDGTGNPFVIHKSHPLSSLFVASTTWQADVFLRHNNSLVSNQTIQFVIDPNATTTTVVDSSTLGLSWSLPAFGESSATLLTPTQNCQYTSSSFFGDPVGNIQQGICQALVFLFIPNSSQQANVNTIVSSTKQVVLTKPPFGYLSLIVSSTNGISTSTATSTTIWIPSSFRSVFDTGMAVVISGLAMVVIFSFVHHFEP